MGTVFSFAWRESPAPETIATVERELTWVDEVFSTYRPDSEISRLAAGHIAVEDCSPEMSEVLGLCRVAEQASAGYFSMTPAGRLDPTGLVKGWAVRRAAGLLSAAGSACHVVNGGGDVLAVAGGSDPPWRIGVAGGSRGTLVARVVARNITVATSGNLERPGEVIDPFTRRPAVSLRSVSVVGEDIVMVDAFATAAVAMGDQALTWLEGMPGYEAVAVAADGRVSSTSGARGWLVSGGWQAQ